MAEKLSIVIKGEQIAENGQQVTQPTTQPTQPSAVSTVLKSVYVTQLANAGIATIKQCFNYQASMYGSTTGDYITQSKIDNTFELVNNVLGVAGSIAGGFAMGGPIGAAVSAVISVGSIAVNSVLGNQSYQLNLRKENAGASFNSAQIGSILTNGNR